MRLKAHLVRTARGLEVRVSAGRCSGVSKLRVALRSSGAGEPVDGLDQRLRALDGGRDRASHGVAAEQYAAVVRPGEVGHRVAREVAATCPGTTTTATTARTGQARLRFACFAAA